MYKCTNKMYKFVQKKAALSLKHIEDKFSCRSSHLSSRNLNYCVFNNKPYLRCAGRHNCLRPAQESHLLPDVVMRQETTQFTLG